MNRWAVALLSLLSHPASAAGPLATSPIEQDLSTERYANDLVGSDVSDRLYAARVLRRRVRTAWRIAGRNGNGFSTIEARQTLAEFDVIVAPRCIRQLELKDVRIPCAHILGMLETVDALPALTTAAQTTVNDREKRIIALAIHRIEESQ